MSVLCPPTTYLPPIAKIASFSVTQLLDALTYLQSLYHPEVRGSRRKRVQAPVSNGEQNLCLPHGDDSELQAIRSDAFERSYSIRWLTTLIAQLEVWQDLRHSEEVSLDYLGTLEPTLAYTEILVQQAASLLAICAGVAAAGMVTRNFVFGSIDGQRRVETQLTDIPLDNDDYGSVGAQTWGGACVLAEMIVEDPERFGLDSSSHVPESRRLNVLELGAGTGLVSLVVMKLLDSLPSFNHREVHVVATDFHPSVLANLRSNVDANVSSTHNQITSTHSITTHFLDWSSFSTTPRPDCLSCPFDVVLGADIIYEAQHCAPVSPAAFHLVIPLRPTHTFESDMVESVFLEASDEYITCDAYGDYTRGQGLDEDVEYVYYKIGWFT
ncbi:putative methyltransferase-domain-containing protein [Suillus discolor]|uniref:Methyltransferase-domain-containing protein n=1 Tax=Suillus discolor TaxID=1912936 RepID=A0A9P7JP03_9AGAM|nr:putative methyltransferase-domain-containing protein [Suillus discolor]KAG2095433.1 putative methyltransferase-domain-containing protein [Suillus discolor]